MLNLRRINTLWVNCIAAFLLVGASPATWAVLPGQLIINEVYFDNYTKDRGAPNHFEAVELLVIKDGINLNELIVSDRDNWDVSSEHECHLQDGGLGFLSSVRAGTLVVIYDGAGVDDTDPTDFTLTLYARSSIFCNAGGKTNAFNLGNYGDNLHVLHRGKQVDFVKFRPNDRPERGGHPGKLQWENGIESFVDVGAYGENTGIRYMGDRADLNNFTKTWQPYPETLTEINNFGLPNGGRNSDWIKRLRDGTPDDAAKPRKKGRSKGEPKSVGDGSAN